MTLRANPNRWTRVWASAIAVAGAALLIGAGAYAAGVLEGSAIAHLHLVHVEGSELNEEGPVSGVLTGTARGELHLGAVFSASFTIYTRAGAIAGRGTAVAHGTGRYQSFAGSFSPTRGSGRYAHIRGRAGLYGVLDRRTDSVVIQTTGRLAY